MEGEIIQIYLVDGKPGGLTKASIPDWTGNIMVVPRSRLKDCPYRAEIERPGVYILAGQDPENPLEEIVYIGQSDDVLRRLNQHNSDVEKEFWVRTAIITSLNNDLSKGHIQYLESCLIHLASKAQRVKNLKNQQKTESQGTPHLPDMDKDRMDKFLERTLLVLPTVGFSFAVPVPTPSSKETLFELKYQGAEATAYDTGNEFVVLKGSSARKRNTESLNKTYVQIREQLCLDEKLVDSNDDGYWKFDQNVPFSSPSAAASVVSGTQLNGQTYWKVKNSDTTYADYQSEQLGAVS